MRRKLAPSPISSVPRTPRALVPAARAGGLLPTAIVLALAGLGCSTPTLDTASADPVTKAKSAETPAPAASPSVAPYIEPEPHELDGDIAIVKPPPLPPAATAASSKPKK